MNCDLSKFKKLLCYLIISLFIMGIGGEKVFAATVNRKSGSSLSTSSNSGKVKVGGVSDGLLDFKNGVASTGNAYFMFDVDGGDGYCLESKQEAPKNGTTMQEVSGGLTDYQKKVAGAVIKASNDNSSLIPDKAERFYVTQALLWEYIGDGPYSAGQGSPFTYNLKTWVHEKYPAFVSKINEAVSNVRYGSSSTLPYTITISGDTTFTDPKAGTSEANRTTETGEMYITADGSSPQDSFHLTCESNDTDGCQIYVGNDSFNGTTGVTISKDVRFHLMTGSVSEGETKRLTLKVTSSRSVSTPSVNVYANASLSGYQQIAVLTSNSSDVSTSIEKTFEYHRNSDTPTETPISFRKIDAITGERIAGAVFKIYDSNNKLVTTLTSTATGDDVKYEHFAEGTYKMVEYRSPDGYDYGTASERTINFSVEKDSSNNFIVKQEGTQVQASSGVVTLVMKNKRTMFRIRKVDQSNQPVAGVKVFLQEPTTYGVTAPTAELPGGANAEYQSSFFGITGTDGYVKMCVDSNGRRDKSCSNTTGDGYYYFGKDLATADGGGGYYTVYETTDNENLKYDFEAFNLGGLNDQYRFGGTVVNNPRPDAPLKVNSTWAFHRESDNTFTIFNKNVKINKTTRTIKDYNNQDITVDVIEITLENHRALNVGKTDVTTGAEIAGAKLVITDPSITGNDSNGNPKNIVDSWTSEAGKTHKVSGIVPGHKYNIREEVAPEGYYKMSTSIDFVMADDGTITTYAPTAGSDLGQELTTLKGTDYELLIPNDVKTLYVSKTSFVTGEEVAGAELKICTKDSYETSGNDCVAKWSWTSGEDGKDESGKVLPHPITGMETGTYYLVETTAPKGYIRQTKAVMFEFNDEEKTQKVEFKNEPTKVTIQKLDLVTKQRVKGATLQILNASDRTIAKDANGTELTWVSREDADWEIYALPAGDYILIEKITPEDYKEGMIIDGITTNEYAFTVSDQEGNLNIKVGIEVLNAPNTGISTLNLFAVGGLLVFVGYQTIRIYRKKTING